MASDNGPRSSVLRGCLYAIPMAAIGFAITFGVCITIVIIQVSPDSPSRYYASNLIIAINGVAQTALWRGVWCAYSFGLSAFLNYTPAKRIGIVNAIINVGKVFLLGALLVYIVAVSIGVERLRFSSPEKWDLRCIVIVFLIPFIYTIIHTAILFRSDSLPDDSSTSPLLKDKTP
ncbi:MAG: hypothetical protein ACKVH8_08855 [Pirellulales bacterium]